MEVTIVRALQACQVLHKAVMVSDTMPLHFRLQIFYNSNGKLKNLTKIPQESIHTVQIDLLMTSFTAI